MTTAQKIGQLVLATLYAHPEISYVKLIYLLKLNNIGIDTHDEVVLINVLNELQKIPY